MKRVTLHRGLFSAEGRFTGFNAAGQSFYIGANMLKSLGIDSTVETAAIPKLYILTEDEKEERLSKPDAEGKTTTFTRWEAKSAFLTFDEMLIASIESELADKKAAAMLAAYDVPATAEQILKARLANA